MSDPPGNGDPMTSDDETAALRERFSARYRVVGSDAVREIERAVFDTDYGASSWTTRAQAVDFAPRLNLGSGDRLLDLGSGAGWPGLFFAAATGSRVTLSDVPTEGLLVARDRASTDGLGGRCTIVAADGAALPFRDGVFDAISHSDVLC